MFDMIRVKVLAYLCLVIILFAFLPIETHGSGIQLTEEEITYIESHSRIITAVDPAFEPYEFFDKDGEYKGIAADYLKLIEVKTGLNFYVLEDKTWAEAYNLALAGKVDLLPIIGITKERQDLFLFTDSYLSYERVLLSAENTPAFNFDRLDSYEKVGVQANTSHHSYLIGETEVEPVVYDDLDSLLYGLSRGEVEVVVANYASSKYRIKDLGITNLKVDQVYDKSSTELAMAVTSDDVMLQSILNKGIDSITEEERMTILNKWLGVTENSDMSQVRNRLINIGLFAIPVLSIVFYWAYLMRREITQRKILERELVEAKKQADESNDAKSVFLAHMSHEIRTPLNAISGLAYLLENTNTSDVQKKYIHNLKDASANLLSIINDILDFSKIEAGEMTVESIPFSIDELLARVSALMTPKVREKSLEFHIRKAPEVYDRTLGDPTRLEQILLNLINNAIKFTESGTVSVNVQQLDTQDGIQHIKFTVTDSGIGISREKQKLLFHPFSQLDSSITRKFGGTGLGLSICHNLVELLGGTIGVISREGQGSSFYFTLPLGMEEASKTSEKVIHPDLRSISVLVLEDDPTDSSIIEEYLAAFSMTCDRVNSIEGVLKALEKTSYRLLIMSDRIEGHSTIPLAESLQYEPIDILLVTGTINEELFALAEANGIRYTIAKPVISSILYDSIVQCFYAELNGYNDAVEGQPLVKRVESHKLLLVEDNEVNQIIAKEILEQKGYEVHVTSDGLEGVKAVEGGLEPELILMDIHMPVMDGYEATTKLRSLGYQGPILAMTAVSFTNIKEECAACGMDGYVTKPVDPEKLFEAIESQIHKGQTQLTHLKQKKTVAGKDRFDKYHYLDIRQGLKRIGHNEKLYYEILLKFIEDTKLDGHLMTERLDKEDYEGAYSIVHKVKGTTGNIGAIKLFQSAKTLMDALKSPLEDNLLPYLEEFLKDHSKTLEVVREAVEGYYSEQIPIGGATSDSEILLEAVELLDQQLLASDLDAFKTLETIKGTREGNNELWLEIGGCMNHYDFKGATNLLARYSREKQA